MSVLRGGMALGVGAARAVVRTWRRYRALRRAKAVEFRRGIARLLLADIGRWEHRVHNLAVDTHGIDHPVMHHLAADAQGLHGQLETARSVTVLVPAGDCGPDALATTLNACLALSAPQLELVIGFLGGPTAAQQAVLDQVGTPRVPIRSVRVTDGGALPAALLRAATHAHALLVEPGDWVRPDTLYRYELLLRAEPAERPVVIGCASRTLSATGGLGPATVAMTSAHPHFPVLLSTESLFSGLLLPVAQARHATDRRPDPSWLDIALDVMRTGARFIHVPLPLCARRAERRLSSTERQAVVRYWSALGLDWQFDTAGRILPNMPGRPSVQVIIPFRDQHDRTLACLTAVRSQTHEPLTVTAVDNGSQDQGIGAAMAAQGVEVLRLDEPFNFSRLINRAAVRSSSDLLLILNNDVRMHPTCLHELATWATQPPIGIVGGALFYPDGTLQQGGIERSPDAASRGGGWEEVEHGRRRADLVHAGRLRVVDAVSAACAMMRRDVFDAVGGFDEVNYPNAFSDTDIARRVRGLGLACVYTPFAEAVHDGGASRRFERLEDVEGSSWFEQVVVRQLDHRERR